MSSIYHLHMEAEIVTVRVHLDMLCAQFLASSPTVPLSPLLPLTLVPGQGRNFLQNVGGGA